MSRARITFTANGFVLGRERGTEEVAFAALSAIDVYKLDTLSTDLICCDLVSDCEGGVRVYTVHEDLAGFDELMERLEALSGFDRGWREAVVLPIFAANRVAIYRRYGPAA